MHMAYGYSLWHYVQCTHNRDCEPLISNDVCVQSDSEVSCVSRSSTYCTGGYMMQCMEVTLCNLLLAELWLKLESCQLVGLLATSVKQQATGESTGESNVIVFII